MAVNAFVGHFADVLCRMGQLKGLSLEEAQDTTQEVFAVFLKKLGEIHDNVKLSTFLFGIFTNTVREQKRKRGRAESHGDLTAVEGLIDQDYDHRGHWLATAAPLPLDQVLATEGQSKLKDCLGSLPDKHQGVLLAVLGSDEDSKELCHTLGLSYVNFRQILTRARQALKVCLESYVKGTHHA